MWTGDDDEAVEEVRRGTKENTSMIRFPSFSFLLSFLFQLATDNPQPTPNPHPSLFSLSHYISSPFLFIYKLNDNPLLHWTTRFVSSVQQLKKQNTNTSKRQHSFQNMLCSVLSIAALLAVAGAQPQSATARTSRAIALIDSDIYLYGGGYC